MRQSRKADEQPLRAAIEEFLDRYRLRDKLNEAKLVHSWASVVGDMIARNTSQLHVKNRVLFVQVNSAALRNELMYARKKIVAALNRAAGADVIDDIVLK